MAANMQIAPRNRTLTRNVSASNISPPSHAAGSLLRQKDFALDKTRALEKKNRSCQKEHINSTLKSENNLVIEFSTAAHELARKCLPQQLNDSTFPHSFKKRDSHDEKGALVDTCYRIFNKKADGTYGKSGNLQLTYTIQPHNGS